MYKKKRTRGAVSVFLTIILVPCIVVSSIFVDISRVYLSRNVAESSSDLALNSLMTNYDYDLSDWYGMAASCQNIDEFYEGSAEYFLRMLSSQGISDDEIVLLSDYYAHATNDDTIYDLLEMESLTDTGDIIKPVDGADMTNATLLKSQIVEFMKYRAPIELTTNIIERLQDDSRVTEKAVEAEENKPLVDSKTAYYEAEGELLAAAFNSYVAIYDYYFATKTNGMTNDKLKEYADGLTDYKKAYEDIHRLMISNLWNTSGLSQYTRVTVALNYRSYDKTNPEIYSRKVTKGKVTHYYIDGAKITSLLKNLNIAITEFNTAKTNYETAASSLMGNLPGDGDSQANSVQWWARMNQAINASSGTNYTEELRKKAENMLDAYAKVLAIDSCEQGKDIPKDWKTEQNKWTSSVTTLQATYLTANVTKDGDSYLKAVNKLEEISAGNIDAIQPSGATITVDGQSKTIEEAIPYISGKLKERKAELQGYIDFLDIAIDGNEKDRSVPKNDRVKSLDKLLKLVQAYDKAKIKWSDKAHNLTTDMATEDCSEIEDIEVDYEEINEQSVNELKTRLENIRTQFQTVLTAIDSMQYGTKTVTDIDSYSVFKSQAEAKVSESEIKLTNGEIKSYASLTFSQLFVPNTEQILNLEHTDEVSYNLNIDPKRDDTPDLFKFFHKKFGGLPKQDVTQKKDELDGGKAAGSDKADEAKNKGRYKGGGTDIAKEFSSEGNFDLLDGSLSGCMSLVEGLVNLDITNMRDDLYVTSYMMNMFSYATYDNEGRYQLIKKEYPETEKVKNLKLTNYEKAYKDVTGSPGNKGTWLSDALVDEYNKSLTNKMINKENNAAYEAEVEYILYGGRDGKGNADNVKAVYSDIYGIRYALNLVSGFKNFWNKGNITANTIAAIASAIAMATGGVVPEPLTKVILIPILTVFETSMDLERLEAGFPVELFKLEADNWWIRVPDAQSVGAFTTALGGTLDGKNQDKGLFYSDYLTLFVYLGLTSENSAKPMYERMAEVIQANIRKMSGETGYSMKKAKVYFELSAEIRVKPLMLTLPIFNDYENDLDTKTDWCTFRISTMRGYT